MTKAGIPLLFAFSFALSLPAEVPVSFMADSVRATLTTNDRAAITKAVRGVFDNPSAPSPYYKIEIQVIYRDNGPVDYAIAYLMSNKTYTFEMAKVEFGESYRASVVTRNYHLSEKDHEQDSSYYTRGSCPDESVQFVAGSQCASEFKTALECITTLTENFKNKGYKTAPPMLNKEATKEAYKNWLSCKNLIAFVNVGHGNAFAIKCADGAFDYKAIESIGKVFQNKTIYINSCLVANHPFQTAFIEGGAAVFAGGRQEVAVGPSEKVCMCFMQSALEGNEMTADLLSGCEKSTNYPNPYAHSLSGNGPYFLNGKGKK